MDVVIIILSSTWKFALTFPVAVYVFKMSFFETLLYTNIGGLLGLITSIVISKGLIKLYLAFWPEKFRRKRKTGKKFTRRNRYLVRLKTTYGLWGIAILTPVLLSIPVGAFLVVKYYERHKLSYLYLMISQLIWSVLYSLFYIKIRVLL